MMGAGQVLVLVVWSFLLATCVHGRTAEEWKSRIIYQVRRNLVWRLLVCARVPLERLVEK